MLPTSHMFIDCVSDFRRDNRIFSYFLHHIIGYDMMVLKVSYTDEKNVLHTIPAKIVCVRNRSNRKDWLAIICTDMELDEKEIIRIYGKRWDIEVFPESVKFKRSRTVW